MIELVNFSIACGWSPAGSKLLFSLNFANTFSNFLVIIAKEGKDIFYTADIVSTTNKRVGENLKETS